jgi:hypothetical protein
MTFSVQIKFILHYLEKKITSVGESVQKDGPDWSNMVVLIFAEIDVLTFLHNREATLAKMEGPLISGPSPEAGVSCPAPHPPITLHCLSFDNNQIRISIG